MFCKNLIKCHHQTTFFLKANRTVSCLLVTRSKSKFKGKRQQNFEKIIYEDKNVPNLETTDFEEGEFLPRRLSYMPEGLPQHRGKKVKWWLPDKTPLTIDINPVEREKEWVEKPEYPPITEMSTGYMRFTSELRESRLDFYRSVRKLPTYDEKQFRLTNLKPILSVNFNSVAKFYDYLPLYKYMTRTHLIQNELPPIYNELNNDLKLDELVSELKPHILNAIKNSIEFKIASQFHEETMHLRNSFNLPKLKKDEALIQNIHNICLKYLINRNEDHLKESNVELNSELHSWWWGSQFRPSKNVKPYQKFKIEKINLSCQFKDYAPLNIRMNEPLRPVSLHIMHFK